MATIDRKCIHRIQTCPHFGAEGFEQWCARQFPAIFQPMRHWGLSQWAAIRVRIEEGAIAECKRLQKVKSDNFKNYVQEESLAGAYHAIRDPLANPVGAIA